MQFNYKMRSYLKLANWQDILNQIYWKFPRGTLSTMENHNCDVLSQPTTWIPQPSTSALTIQTTIYSCCTEGDDIYRTNGSMLKIVWIVWLVSIIEPVWSRQEYDLGNRGSISRVLTLWRSKRAWEISAAKTRHNLFYETK